MVKKGQIVELTIESAAFEGSTVARHNDLVVFVRKAVPGDRLLAKIRRKRRRHAEASVEEILDPSPHRVEPRCRHFESCGGCTWQNYRYDQQLASKQQQVTDLFERIGDLESFEVRPTIPSPESFYYRNKMEFTFGASRWLTREEIASGQALERGFALGLHIPKRFDKILDLEECHLQSPRSAELVNFFRRLALDNGWSAYDSRSHIGYLRNLVIRTGTRTGELLVNLVTSRSEPQRMEQICSELLKAFPETTTFINSVNDTHSPVAAGKETVLHGEGFIHDQIGERRFRIGATTFFQPNTLQAEKLFSVAREMAGLKGDETVYDLYCGIGAISLFLSDSAALVAGFDHHEQSIQDAAVNSQSNGVKNCRFFAMDAREALRPGVTRELGLPQLVVLDPPRVGLHKDVCQAVLQSSVPRLVYISCNPATQARDLKILSPRYSIRAVQPVDMFPQTYHIENVVLLEAR